jgi:hypothetical protein
MRGGIFPRSVWIAPTPHHSTKQIDSERGMRMKTTSPVPKKKKRTGLVPRSYHPKRGIADKPEQQKTGGLGGLGKTTSPLAAERDRLRSR